MKQLHFTVLWCLPQVAPGRGIAPATASRGAGSAPPLPVIHKLTCRTTHGTRSGFSPYNVAFSSPCSAISDSAPPSVGTRAHPCLSAWTLHRKCWRSEETEPFPQPQPVYSQQANEEKILTNREESDDTVKGLKRQLYMWNWWGRRVHFRNQTTARQRWQDIALHLIIK